MLANLVSRTRRNHALEHATIHVLSEKFKTFGAQGNSTHKGFYLNIYGEVAPKDVEQAVMEAHDRLKKGEHNLALHPNCGTVLLTTATLATLAGQGVVSAEQKRLRQTKLNTKAFMNVLPTAVLAVVFTLIASRPVGMYLQTYTTNGHISDLEVKQIKQVGASPVTHFFRVLLGQNKQMNVHSYFVETTGG